LPTIGGLSCVNPIDIHTSHQHFCQSDGIMLMNVGARNARFWGLIQIS
jgi:hypothetical protein